MLSRFLPAIVACLATFVAAPSLVAAAPPNIVLIMADDMGYSDLGCFGAQGIKTPHLDKLADEGTRFTRFSQVVLPRTHARPAGRLP